MFSLMLAWTTIEQTVKLLVIWTYNTFVNTCVMSLYIKIPKGLFKKSICI